MTKVFPPSHACGLWAVLRPRRSKETAGSISRPREKPHVPSSTVNYPVCSE